MLGRKLRGLYERPSNTVPFLSSLIGGYLGRHQFSSDCTVEPLCQITNPEMLTIGDGTYLKNFTVVKPKGPDGIRIGDSCSLNEFSFLSGNITIGDDVRIATNVSLHSFDHETDPERPVHEQGLEMYEIDVGDDVWIGAGAQILKDTTIGDKAVIGAGSVVTRDVSPRSIVAGNPAEEIGYR